MSLPQFYVDDIILCALKEDINYLDVSADYLIPEDQRNDAYFVAKADGVLCGLDVALRTFRLLDDTFTAKVYKKDGDKIQKGDLIAEFSGKKCSGSVFFRTFMRRKSGGGTMGLFLHSGLLVCFFMLLKYFPL